MHTYRGVPSHASAVPMRRAMVNQFAGQVSSGEWAYWKSLKVLTEEVVREGGFIEQYAALYELFVEYAGSDVEMTKDQYFELLKYFPCTKPEFRETFFDLFDRNGDGYITRFEFIGGAFGTSPEGQASILTANGKLRLQLIFTLYDMDKDGYLSTGELSKMLSHICKALGSKATRPSNDPWAFWNGMASVLGVNGCGAPREAHDEWCSDVMDVARLSGNRIGYDSFYKLVQTDRLKGTSLLVRCEESLPDMAVQSIRHRLDVPRGSCYPSDDTAALITRDPTLVPHDEVIHQVDLKISASPMGLPDDQENARSPRLNSGDLSVTGVSPAVPEVVIPSSPAPRLESRTHRVQDINVVHIEVIDPSPKQDGQCHVIDRPPPEDSPGARAVSQKDQLVSLKDDDMVYSWISGIESMEFFHDEAITVSPPVHTGHGDAALGPGDREGTSGCVLKSSVEDVGPGPIKSCVMRPTPITYQEVSSEIASLIPATPPVIGVDDAVVDGLYKSADICFGGSSEIVRNEKLSKSTGPVWETTSTRRVVREVRYPQLAAPPVQLLMTSKEYTKAVKKCDENAGALKDRNETAVNIRMDQKTGLSKNNVSTHARQERPKPVKPTSVPDAPHTVLKQHKEIINIQEYLSDESDDGCADEFLSRLDKPQRNSGVDQRPARPVVDTPNPKPTIPANVPRNKPDPPPTPTEDAGLVVYPEIVWSKIAALKMPGLTYRNIGTPLKYPRSQAHVMQFSKDILTCLSNRDSRCILDPYMYAKADSTPKLLDLCEAVVPLLQVEDSCVNIELSGDNNSYSKSLVVIGSVHGNIADLREFFDVRGWPHERPEASYLFLGNLVDRGTYSLEVVSLVFALKVLYPDRVFCLRGSHEDIRMNKAYGFYEECCRRLPDETTKAEPNGGLVPLSKILFDYVNDVFEFLPMAAVVNDHIFCVHSGIGESSIRSKEDICRIPKPIRAPVNLDLMSKPGKLPVVEQRICDCLWSSFDDTGSPERNVVSVFTEGRVQAFCEKNRYHCIIRSHECVRSGVETSVGGKLITVYTAVDHHPNSPNDAGVVEIQFDDQGVATMSATILKGRRAACNEGAERMDTVHPNFLEIAAANLDKTPGEAAPKRNRLRDVRPTYAEGQSKHMKPVQKAKGLEDDLKTDHGFLTRLKRIGVSPGNMQKAGITPKRV